MQFVCFEFFLGLVIMNIEYTTNWIGENKNEDKTMCIIVFQGLDFIWTRKLSVFCVGSRIALQILIEFSTVDWMLNKCKNWHSFAYKMGLTKILLHTCTFKYVINNNRWFYSRTIHSDIKTSENSWTLLIKIIFLINRLSISLPECLLWCHEYAFSTSVDSIRIWWRY